MTEKYTNNGASTLAVTIDDDDTTVVVSSATSFPTAGTFRIRIGDELMIVTAVSGANFTVTRGAEGTTAAGHSSGAPVKEVLTAGSLTQIVYDLSGAIQPMSFDSSDFTAENDTNASITDSDGAIVIRHDAQGNVEDCVLLVRPAPTPPYSIVAVFDLNTITSNSFSFPHAGIGVRYSGEGKIEAAIVGIDGSTGPKLALNRWDDPTTNNGLVASPLSVPGQAYYLKLEDDTTNIKYSFSSDGKNWIPYLSHSRTSFFSSVPDEVLFLVNNKNSIDHELVARLRGYYE